MIEMKEIKEMIKMKEMREKKNKAFIELKEGDVIHERHKQDDMEAWWVLESNKSFYKSFKAVIVHSIIGPTCTNRFIDHVLSKEEYKHNYVGSREDYPEYFI